MLTASAPWWENPYCRRLESFQETVLPTIPKAKKEIFEEYFLSYCKYSSYYNGLLYVVFLSIKYLQQALTGIKTRIWHEG